MLNNSRFPRSCNPPPDDESGVQVEDRGKIQLGAHADDELGRVADLALVRRVGRELSTQAGPGAWELISISQLDECSTGRLGATARIG